MWVKITHNACLFIVYQLRVAVVHTEKPHTPKPMRGQFIFPASEYGNEKEPRTARAAVPLQSWQPMSACRGGLLHGLRLYSVRFG